MRLKQILKQRDISAATLAREIGTDKYIMSKFTNQQILLIPPMMHALCKYLNVAVLDIVSEEEIRYYDDAEKRTLNACNTQSSINCQGELYKSNLQCCNSVATKNKSEPDCYKVSARVNNDFRKVVTNENFAKQGYNDLSDFIRKQLKQFEYDLQFDEPELKRLRRQVMQQQQEIEKYKQKLNTYEGLLFENFKRSNV